jgi:hypothetical protein
MRSLTLKKNPSDLKERIANAVPVRHPHVTVKSGGRGASEEGREKKSEKNFSIRNRRGAC